MKVLKRFTALGLAAFLAACAASPAEAPGPSPALSAPATGKGMVAAANPHAVEAGLRVLREGGTAVDAAVAVQAVLGLVEPQSSGLGGGAFMVFYDAKTSKVTAYNGRETAPAGAAPDMFMEAGKPASFRDAVVSGEATGVPGAVAMLGLAHSRHGKLAWNRLFSDAERLADQGFVVSPRMGRSIASGAPQNRTPDNLRYFTNAEGVRMKAGDLLKNPAYADTVRRIAAQGPRALLQGEIAQSIVDKVHEGPNPGTLSLADLAAYQPKSSPALCRPYKVYVVCTTPPPSSGVGVLQGLAILDSIGVGKHPNTAEGWYLFAQGTRLMYADRDRYVGDPDFVSVPVDGLLDPAYIAERVKLIGPTGGQPLPHGQPRGAPKLAADRTAEPAGTTHFVIVDAAGNAVSMTTTVESIFGNGRMVHGFFLNNQLTDFSFSPKNADGTAAANAVAPRKRPRSSMSPLVVLDRQGRFVAAVGSPGGNAILAYNLKAMTGVFEWGMPMDKAIALPNLISRGAVYDAEVSQFQPDIVQALAARGVKLLGGGSAEGSGLHGILMTPDGLTGAADPRREGVARRP